MAVRWRSRDGLDLSEPVRPVAVLGFGPMRLRTLSEAECYARCYGGHGEERVSVVRLSRRSTAAATARGERLRELFEERLDGRDAQAEAA
jgi:hypothetical protein